MTITRPRITELAINLSGMKYEIGEQIWVSGYHTSLDDSSHLRVVKQNDDGSGILMANGNWACVSLHLGHVRASWFGAKFDGVTSDTAAITKAHNFYRYDVRLDTKPCFLGAPIPLGRNSSYSGLDGKGTQWPSGNVVEFFIPATGMTNIFDTRLTSDDILRNFKLSAIRFSQSSLPNVSLIYCDVPMGAFEVDHIHLETYAFLTGTISSRFNYAGKFVSMGSRMAFTSCTFMTDYTIKFDKGVAGSAWCNQNYAYNCQLGTFDIEATMQNWHIMDCLYEARAYSNGSVGVRTLPLFEGRSRIENLLIDNLYAEGIYSGTASTGDWADAQASGVKVRDVTVYNTPSTSTTYSIYDYAGLRFAGVVGGALLGTVNMSAITPIVRVPAAAKVTFNGGVFAAFQCFLESKSNFYIADVTINSPEIFDGNENGVGDASAALTSALAIPMIKVQASGRANVKWNGNKCSYRHMSNLPIQLVTDDNIRQISSYNDTRTSGNTTYQNKIRVNSDTIFLTTNTTYNNGSGLTEVDPILVPASLASALSLLAPHDNIVFVNSAIQHISIATLPFFSRILLKNSTIDVPMQSFGNPYINAPHGLVLMGSGATINFTGTLPAGSGFDYWINQVEGKYLFRGLAINGNAANPVSLINNTPEYTPDSIRFSNVVGNGGGGVTRVYISKVALSSTTAYTLNATTGLTGR